MRSRGGDAVSLHGAVRGTLDVDLVIPSSAEQYSLVEQSLNSIGLTGRLPVGAEAVFQNRREYIENRNLIARSFVNADDPSELVDILITEDLEALQTIDVKVREYTLHVVGLDDLIEMKVKADGNRILLISRRCREYERIETNDQKSHTTLQ